MVKTGAAHGASSSSKAKGKQVEKQYKRRKYVGRDEDSEEETPTPMEELSIHDKPKWESGPLNEKPREWQAILFHDQMKNLKDRGGAFICERDVKEVQFAPFNVVDRFRALGWEAALHCYDGNSKYLYMEEIEEWMATLRCPRYDSPSKMKLIGEVNGVEVEMSWETIRRLAKFDSLSSNKYMLPNLDDLLFKPDKHPKWTEMLDALFISGTYHGTLYRRNLKIEAKLLLAIIIMNVIPRRADKQEVRFPEIPILYSLMKGSPKFPLRYLILNHVWMCRNSVGRRIIPYCRLITALMMQQKAITADDVGKLKRYKSFELKTLGLGWTYTESDRYHKLKSEGQRWRALKVDARRLLPGEQDEPESEDEPPSGDEDYVEEPRGRHMDLGQGSSGHAHGGSFYDFTERSYEENWAFGGSMQQVIENQRPPASIFDTWSGSERTLFDHQTLMSASMERSMRQGFERQEMWNRAHAYSQEVEINHRYVDDQNRRMHEDWHAGRPVVANPQPVDYGSLPPYDGSISYPTPPLHHSQWVDPQQQQPQASEQGGSGSGAFGFGDWNELMTSVFGPPQPRYY